MCPGIGIGFDDEAAAMATGLASGQFGDSDFNTHYFSLAGDNIDDKITGALYRSRPAGPPSAAGWTACSSASPPTVKVDLVNNALTGEADYYSGDYAINISALGDVISNGFNLPNFMSKIDSQFPRFALAFDIANYRRPWPPR